MPADDPVVRPLSAVLAELAADGSRPRISVADLLTALSDQAGAALLLLFALPNVVPAPPGMSALLGAPLLFLALQLALGRRPWLPAFIASRSLPHQQFAAVVKRAGPWLERAERLMKPRLAVLAQRPFEFGLGVVCTLLAVLVFLPIPLGNMLPALAICLMALGLLERDGLWVIAGLCTAVASVALVWGVLHTVVQSALFVLMRFFG